MSVVGDANVHISGRDVASYFYNKKSGLYRLTGLVYWLFRWKVTTPAEEFHSMIWKHRESYFINSFLQSRAVTGVPRVAKTLPKQKYSFSCGAQAIRQTALDLGVSYLPDKEVYKFQGQSIEDSSAEEAIYGITGGLLDSNMKRQLMSPEESDAISLPDGMLTAARALGLDGRLYCSSLRLRCYLSLNYPEEWGRASELSPVKHGVPPKLSLNERCIHALEDLEDRGGFHWVMERPDGYVYNPGNGQLYENLEVFCSSHSFKATGVSLLISDRSAYPKGGRQEVNRAASEPCRASG